MSISLGINGLLALKDIANQKGWKISANEHFDPISDYASLDVSPQLEAIRKTHTRIVVLNTMARYTVVVLTQAFNIGMLKDWIWIVTDGSTNTVSPSERASMFMKLKHRDVIIHLRCIFVVA